MPNKPKRRIRKTGPEAPGRVFPVEEFLTRVAEERPLIAALREAGQEEEMWKLSAAFAARIIEKHMRRPARLRARMLAGALMEAVAWWLDHPGERTAKDVDSAFHALAAQLR